MIFMIKYLCTHSVNTSKCIYVCISKRIGFMFMGLERRSVLKLQSHFSFLLQRFVIDLDKSRILQRLQQYENRSDRKGKHPRHLQYIQ